MALNTQFISEGATKPDSLAVDSYEAQLSASRVMPLPNNQQLQIEWDSTGSVPLYLGVAGQGFSTSSGTDNDTTKSNWMIKKFTWDSNNNPTVVQTGWGKWTSRASLTYA